MARNETEIARQLDEIAPSVKPALFRRLLSEEGLGYLRDENTIIGFEVKLDSDQRLQGYAILGAQKHTLLVYRSELDEEKRLILFPTLDKLEDPEFGLLGLQVERKIFDNDRFDGQLVRSGTLQTVAADIIPPYKEVTVSDDVATEMDHTLREATFKEPETDNTDVTENVLEDDLGPADDMPVDLPPDDFEDNNFDPTSYEEPAYDTPAPEPESKQDYSDPDRIVPQNDRSKQLDSKQFKTLNELNNFAVIELSMNPNIVNTVVSAALNTDGIDGETDQIDIAKLLLIRLIDEKGM